MSERQAICMMCKATFPISYGSCQACSALIKIFQDGNVADFIDAHTERDRLRAELDEVRGLLVGLRSQTDPFEVEVGEVDAYLIRTQPKAE